MADLSYFEKQKLEEWLDMSSGYVLNFTDRTFAEFFKSTININIFDNKYNYASGSKAHRMRSFFEKENNHLVGKILYAIFSNWSAFKNTEPPEGGIELAKKLLDSYETKNINVDITGDESLELLEKQINSSVNSNSPKVGLDRLHTFLVRYMRNICSEREIQISKNKPLHSLLGEYIKQLKQNNEIKSEMTEKILKSSISLFEAFNTVRNNNSFAHDNDILSNNESKLIFDNIISIINFINEIEEDHKQVKTFVEEDYNFTDEEVPF